MWEPRSRTTGINGETSEIVSAREIAVVCGGRGGEEATKEVGVEEEVAPAAWNSAAEKSRCAGGEGGFGGGAMVGVEHLDV